MKLLGADKSKGGLALPAAAIIVAASFLFYSATVSENVANADSLPSEALFAAPLATFAGAGVGAIPDGGSACAPTPGAARDVTFAATGLGGSPTSVGISMTFGSPNHTFIGDVVATLIAPNGSSFTIFGRTGSTTATGFGGSSDLGATYVFSDNAPAPPSGGWWQEENIRGAAEVMTAGTYRSTAIGGAGATNPQPPTSINAAFAGVPNSNGTWTLRLTDGCQQDTGAIAAATLTVQAGPAVRSRADFDGDGKTDLGVFRASDANWYLNRSTNGFLVQNWGVATDIPAPGDFDGDGKTDFSIFRPSTGTWWIIRSQTGSVVSIPWGASGDTPVVGDYNGDGSSDVAVYRPSNNGWYIQPSGGGTIIAGFGTTGDLPVRGDYDGNGSTDIAIFRPSTGQWWISGGPTISFGVSTDKPVPADYDGDNKDDIAIFRPSSGQWWILSSANGSVSSAGFGISTDVPVPGDYDGDGRDDLAVYRNGTWWLNRSTTGVVAQSFGVSTDVPIPTKYIP